jgi:hypothetical protein
LVTKLDGKLLCVEPISIYQQVRVQVPTLPFVRYFHCAYAAAHGFEYVRSPQAQDGGLEGANPLSREHWGISRREHDVFWLLNAPCPRPDCLAASSCDFPIAQGTPLEAAAVSKGLDWFAALTCPVDFVESALLEVEPLVAAGDAEQLRLDCRVEDPCIAYEGKLWFWHGSVETENSQVHLLIPEQEEDVKMVKLVSEVSFLGFADDDFWDRVCFHDLSSYYCYLKLNRKIRKSACFGVNRAQPGEIGLRAGH